MPIQPTPSTWTLRFKNHKTTVLLHVEKTQTFTTIKNELLVALRETSPDGSLYGTLIPDNADAVLLARQIDINDPEAGWESLDSILEDDTMFEDESKKGGKGKGKGKSGFKDCPLGCGLRDGAAVAFKFRSEQGDSAGTGTKLEDDDETLGLEDGDKEAWDVVIPSYEDVYGMEELEAEGT